MGDFIHFHILNILGALDNLFNANQKMKTLFNLTSPVIESFLFCCKIALKFSNELKKMCLFV